MIKTVEPHAGMFGSLPSRRRLLKGLAGLLGMAGIGGRGDVGDPDNEHDERSLEDYANEDGYIDTDGLVRAIQDWRDGVIQTGLLLDVIHYWRTGERVFIQVTLDLSLAESGPFTADGADTATVDIHAADEAGQPVEGLVLEGSLTEGSDGYREVPVDELGGGDYQVSIDSTVAGEHRLDIVESESGGDTALSEQFWIDIAFEPGPAESIAIFNFRPPELGAERLSASVHAAVVDAHGNSVPRAQEAVEATADDPDATIELVDMHENITREYNILYEGNPSPGENNWASLTVTIGDTVTGLSATKEVQFPFIGSTQRAVELEDGEVGSAITLHSLNFAPLQSFNVFFPYDSEDVELDSVTDPDPDNGFSIQTQEDDGGVYVWAEAEDADTAPTTGLATLNFRHLTSAGLHHTEVQVWELAFEGFEPIESLEIVPLKKVPPVDICVRVWVTEGCGDDLGKNRDAEHDVQEMERIFALNTLWCCPPINFQVEYEEITAEEWDQVDEHPENGMLDDWTKADWQEQSPEEDKKVNTPAYTAEEDALAKHVLDDDMSFQGGCINVFYVPDINGAAGRAYGEISPTSEGGPWSHDTDGAQNEHAALVSCQSSDDRTLAHEVAHVIGELRDNPGPAGKENLMNNGPGDEGTFLTEEQCAKIRELQL